MVIVGSASYNQTPAVLVLLQGVLDFTKEIAKLVPQRDQVVKTLERLIQRRSGPEYGSKVPLHVQQNDADKVRKLHPRDKMVMSQILLCSLMSDIGQGLVTTFA